MLNLTNIEYSSYGTDNTPAKIYIVYDRVYEASYTASLSYNLFSSSDITLSVTCTNSIQGQISDYLFTIIHNNKFIPVGGVLVLEL